mmetsp:Transcript_20066/g.60641  ORF Transcript_20066/g.60641 Transcript_20066/m.60641 type:complete len:412 (-) Transcript_20066:569-1804(-)
MCGCRSIHFFFALFKLDHVVDTQHSDGCFRRKLNNLDFREDGLQNAGLHIVTNRAILQVQTLPAEVAVVLPGLRRVVVAGQPRHQLRRILASVNCKGLRDDQQRVRKLCDGQLLPAAQSLGEAVQVYAEGRLHRATSWHDRAGFQDALDDAEGVVQRPVHLVQQVVVGAPQQHRHGAAALAPLDHQHIIVRHRLLHHLIGIAKAGCIKGLISLHVCQRADHLPPGCLGYPPEIILGHPPHSDGARLHEVLQRHVVDPLGCQNHVGASRQDLLDALGGDAGLPLPNLLQLGRVRHQHLNAHVHALLLQVHVQAGDSGPLHPLHHALTCASHVERIAIHQHALPGALAVRLEHADCLHGISHHAGRAGGLNRQHRIHRHLRKEVALSPNDLGRHGSFGAIDERILAQRVHIDR